MKNNKLAIQVKGNQQFMNKEIPVVHGGFGANAKCVSDKTIAQIHGMREADVRRRITDNVTRFREDIDFVDIKKGVHEAHTLKILLEMGYSKSAITQAEHIYILSERGYAKLIKIMDTDLAWEIHDRLIDEYFELREEKKKLVGMTDYQKQTIKIKEDNVNERKAKMLERIGNKYEGTTYQQILYAYATKILTGDFLLPLPEIGERTFSATEIGDKLGISASKVGRLAKANDLKIDRYGKWYNDVSKNSKKEVPCFRYFESVVPVIKKLIG